ncbi:radical SAM protein [Thermomonospora cellulosilytica]|uniref:Radical SAM protein with 4Fe4S-binding SPASM domain n=1 Tax=Thermomonospora cellulosilytica TaxID=1411118 RepID=A0A7W3N1U5_9ACTN|nr:radical SAM protein [Thermomonospora cellulosilytica]MBA9005929.1 radical SAM protein with 4Fe4S-binding SPASM domain [Thermomonospora cellulosilytica]
MKRLIVDTHAASCYFRTSVPGDGRKALVQITERCNLHCAHCFVSSTREGLDMAYQDLVEMVVPRLLAARVRRITLTGGEPFAHPDLLRLCRHLTGLGLPVGICSNATLISDEQIAELAALGGVHVNVSLDGFSADSHGKFRGNRSSFQITVDTIRRLADAGLLQGLLSTPNALTFPREFEELCAFAVEVGAEYVLMNPLSSMGRGVKSKDRMAADTAVMDEIRRLTDRFRGQGVDVVHIRFPNGGQEGKPLSGCDAGKLIYVFADGEVAVCPYLVFAARTPHSQHPDSDFLVGNILDPAIADTAVADALDGYDTGRLAMGVNPTCTSCGMNSRCGKGCPAAVIASGGRIGGVDTGQCPVTGPAPAGPLLQIGRPPTRPARPAGSA